MKNFIYFLILGTFLNLSAAIAGEKDTCADLPEKFRLLKSDDESLVLDLARKISDRDALILTLIRAANENESFTKEDLVSALLDRSFPTDAEEYLALVRETVAMINESYDFTKPSRDNIHACLEKNEEKPKSAQK